jgi:uncharacterized membrane protein
MTAGMVLDKAFRLYLQNFALMIGLSAILNIPLLAFTMFFGGGRISPNSVNVAGIMIALLVFVLAMLVIVPLITGATTAAVSDIYLGNMVTAGSALSAAWRKAWTLLKTQFIVGLIVGVGILLIIVPGILWALSYALVAPVIMIEGTTSGSEVRRRSWELVRGNRGKVFLILFALIVIQWLVGVGIGIISVIGQFGFGASNITMISQVLNGIVSILLTPMSAIAVTLLYYDFRIRKEGFDLEMLSRAVGGATPEA